MLVEDTTVRDQFRKHDSQRKRQKNKRNIILLEM